ncbi:MAG: phosphoribosyl-ATP diphosphatase [Pseudomonadota bacterium]
MSETDVLTELENLIKQRLAEADGSNSYIAQLASKGDDAVLKKIGEEATETVLAAKDGQVAGIVHETADLWFHCMVMLASKGISIDAVFEELAGRMGISGLTEKASRSTPDAENSN